MDSLIIESTEDSPSINFDIVSKRLVISGESRPENAGKFYAPVIDWIEKLEQRAKGDNSPLVFAFKLDYFNSTSAKYIMDIIITIKELVVKGCKVNIEWNYDKRDDDMLEAGKEFSDAVEMEFDFITY